MSAEQIEVHGACRPEFESVRDAFAANFAERDEIGASAAVVIDGEPVVDLWAGWADVARTRPWQQDTIVNVWSTSKAVTALAAHILIDRGELDPDSPVARYWPEFGQAGKDEIPVRWVLCHKSGLTGLSVPTTIADFYDWEKITTALAAQAPLFPPGTATGYQAVTFGFLVGELIRRITGQAIREFVACEVTGPVGADFHFGLTDAEISRCADVQPVRLSDAEQAAMAEVYANASPAALAALANPAPSGDEANDPQWRKAVLPAANGHSTALALATIFGAVADRSGTFISPGTLEKARVSEGRSIDIVFGIPLEFGLGVELSGPEGHFGPNPAAFGHDGFGGSAVGCDPEAGVAFGYVMNRMSPNLIDDPRKMALLDASYESLKGR
jgi:CubicO group peptidase (beta-lactamase class C family)